MMTDDNGLPVGSTAEDEENGGDTMSDIDLNDLDTVEDDPMAEDVSPENIDDDTYGSGIDDEELDGDSDEDNLDEDEDEEGNNDS